ncbi:Sec8 [Blastocystis sp. ATCC 50177/Nand II]|uniref:Exocyst complex component Sec8 n=1 Tax=Blastocystis sp. subtype 1 (strain ATCC 50177 / NandII) TaxID=478820 RepID=A0A196SL15_BLAHN|nr:Sec8 [Blastocystis sp. ATCC 50177/Nand II]
MIQYIFHGSKNKMPTRFERLQMPRLTYNSSAMYTDEESLLLLDIQTDCTVEAEGSTTERLFYSVFSATVLFHSEEELAFFLCNSSTPLNTRIPLSTTNCSAFAFSHIRLSLESERLTTFFDANDVLVSDWLGEMTLPYTNRDACSSSFVGLLGTFLSFFLIVGFLFLLLFAYNTKRRPRFVGNGIDVKNIQYISKPFSSGINPYSKKSKEIPVNPEPKQHTPLSYIIDMVDKSQTMAGEAKERAFLQKQMDAIEKCLTPIVQAYYADYNKSLESLTAICDDFRKNQKEVQELVKRVQDVKARLECNRSGIKDLYYEKLLTEYTMKSLKNIEYIRQSPKMIDHFLENGFYIHASNLYNEVATILSDKAISEVPTVMSLQGFWDMKKKDIENALMDRLLSVVYPKEVIEWSSYTDEGYDYFALTEEKEKELVTNGRFSCSKYTAIALIIKAATIIGCNVAAQNRLQSNSVNNINEIVVKNVKKCGERVASAKDPLEKGEAAVESALKSILIACEDVFKTHICCIECFQNSCVASKLNYEENINTQYNTLSVYSSIQIAIQGFIEKFITLPTTSSAASALKLARDKKGQGSLISFSFSASPAWVSSQQSVLNDLSDKKISNDLFAALAEPDPLLLSMITFYVKSFSQKCTILANSSLEKMNAQLATYPHKPGAEAEQDMTALMGLSNFLEEHIEADLVPALHARAVSIVQAATGRPESYLVNEEDGHMLNCVLDICRGFEELQHACLQQQQNYYQVIECLSQLVASACSKFTNLIDEMVRTSFAKKRYDWASNGGKLLLLNNAQYHEALREIPDFPAFEYTVLSAQEQQDEDNAINSDIYSFFVDPPVDKNSLLVNGRVTLLCNLCEGCAGLMKRLLQLKQQQHRNIDVAAPLDLTLYDEVVEKGVQALRGVYDYALQILMYEITGRCFHYIERLTTSFRSVSYNNVPTVVMELMKDMKGFSDIVIKICSPGRVKLLGWQLEFVLSTLLMRCLTHLPVEEVDVSIINTLKQSGVCCSQIMTLLLPLDATIAITRKLNDYFSLALLKKEEIRDYIKKNPTRFTNIEYMNLFKITTANRERDDAAIDWIEDILKASERKSAAAGKRR